jgi:crotonobetaine/carnitine-CoA ligase
MPDYRGPERSVAKILRNAVALWGDRPWVIAEDRAYSFREMEERAEALAGGLVRQGVRAGDTVLVMLPNSATFVTLWLALARIGAIQVPLNTAYRGKLLADIVNDSRARRLVVAAEHLDRLSEVAADLAHLEELVVWSDAAWTLPAALAQRWPAAAFETLTDGTAVPLPPVPNDNDLVAVMYTSGTTGPSKGVMITHAHAYQYAASDNPMGLGPGDVYYAPLPMFHIAGQWAVIYNCLIRGATAVVKRRFSIAEFWDDIARYGVTVTFMLGAMGSFLFRATEGERHSTLKRVLMSPLIPELDEFRRRFGVMVCTAYGSTEVNGCIATDLSPPNAQTCGRLRADKFEVRLVDEDDREVLLGQVGELVVRPREPWIVMAGYWNRPQETVRAWRNLWLHSGDLMRRDEAGYYYFVDRLKDAIRRRGENISSLEVEREIAAHPAVFEAAVYPVDSAHTEQEVAAAIVLKPNLALDPAALMAFLRPRMARFMLPRYLRFIDALPRTPTGKIQKFQLRALGAADAWDAEAELPRQAAR